MKFSSVLAISAVTFGMAASVACGGDSDDGSVASSGGSGGAAGHAGSVAAGGSSAGRTQAAGSAGAAKGGGGATSGGAGGVVAAGSGGAKTAGAGDVAAPGGSAGSGGSIAGAGGAIAGSGGTEAGGEGGAEAGGDGGAGGAEAGGDGGAGGADVGGAPSCDSFTVAPVPSPVKVSIQNDSSHNIYLGDPTPDCLFDLGFTVTDGSNAELKLAQQNCDLTCGTLQKQGCSCPPGSCVINVVTLVAPGAHFDIGWTGTAFTATKMPSACYEDTSCADTSCYVEAAVPAGTYDIGTTVYGEADGCGPNGDMPCPDCTAGAAGSCIVTGATKTGGTATPLDTTWTGDGHVILYAK